MIPLEPSAAVSVIVPNYNGAAFLGKCLDSLAAQTLPPLEVIVVDNGSSDDSLEVTRRRSSIARVVPQDANLGFAAAANAGVRIAAGEWVAILNNDTEADPGWLAACLDASGRHPGAAFIASRIMDYSERDRVYSAGDCALRAGIGYRRGQNQRIRSEHRQEVEVFAPSGCASLFRRTAFEESGGYEERFFAYLEDVELGIRLRAAGRGGWYAPDAVVYHIGGATSGGEFSPLAVRLRTRNALLLLLRTHSPAMLLGALPRVALSQAFWLGRVLARGRILSYLRGLCGVFPEARKMVAARQRLAREGRYSPEALRVAMRKSEVQAACDAAAGSAELGSSFLRCYFGLFGASAGLGPGKLR